MSEEKNYLELSDEEILELDPEELEQESTEASDPTGETEVEEGADESDTQDDEEEEAEGASDNSPSVSPDDPGPDAKAPRRSGSAEETVTEAEAEQKVSGEKDSSIDYQAQFEELTRPFKANGMEMSVSNVEEARLLMQKGVNYEKKMSELKPNLKVVKALDKVGLLDLEKLGLMIDVYQKKPEALNRFFKQQELSPHDVDPDEDQESYSPRAPVASDEDYAIDEVIDELRPTPTFNRLVEEITNNFDSVSKQIIRDKPQLMTVFNDHIATGVYNQIRDQITRERVLGRLTGLNDLEAYKTVGDEMQRLGMFNETTAEATEKSPVSTAATERNQKRRAAAPPKGKASGKKVVEKDWLKMSDEEFEKASLGA